MLRYRLLLPSEFSALEQFNAENKIPPAIEGFNHVAVIQDGENNSEIVARWDILLQAHLDNGCIAPKYRGRFLNLKRLYSLLESALPVGQRVYSTSSSENGARILELINFKPYPFPLFTKDK